MDRNLTLTRYRLDEGNLRCTVNSYLGITLGRPEKGLGDDSTGGRVRGKTNALVVSVEEGVPGNLVQARLLALGSRARDAVEAGGRLWGARGPSKERNVYRLALRK